MREGAIRKVVLLLILVPPILLRVMQAIKDTEIGFGFGFGSGTVSDFDSILVQLNFRFKF